MLDYFIEDDDLDDDIESEDQFDESEVELYQEDILANVSKLTKDVKEASKQIDANEARFLVDLYYSMQNLRIHVSNQIRSIGDANPHSMITHIFEQTGMLERQTATALDIYTSNHIIGRWMKSIIGVGPVISAGLLAHIDIRKAKTSGHICSYAGLNPKIRWCGVKEVSSIISDVMGNSKVITDEHIVQFSIRTGRQIEYIERNKHDDKGKVTKKQMQKILSLRPWNAKLKLVCWKLGKSFVKVCNHNDDVYGKLYRQRKLYEMKNNEELLYKEQADKKLETDIGKDTEAYKWYSIGKLPPAQIQRRAERYAVKIFLSHLHYIWWKYEFKKEPVDPYAIDILGHSDMIEAPNQYIVFGNK